MYERLVKPPLGRREGGDDKRRRCQETCCKAAWLRTAETINSSSQTLGGAAHITHVAKQQHRAKTTPLQHRTTFQREGPAHSSTWIRRDERQWQIRANPYIINCMMQMREHKRPTGAPPPALALTSFGVHPRELKSQAALSGK